MFEKVNNRVLELFLKNPLSSFHLREIARLTGLSPAGASKILKKMEKTGLILKTKTKLKTDFIVNRENKDFIVLKKSFNIYELNKTRLIDYLVEKYKFPEAIILFGSYAKGEDTEKSDIDITIITKLELNLNLKEFEKKLNKKINIHEIKNFSSISKEFKNNLVNGITLYGYLKVFK